jgi:hypothetical protein
MLHPHSANEFMMHLHPVAWGDNSRILDYYLFPHLIMEGFPSYGNDSSSDQPEPFSGYRMLP